MASVPLRMVRSRRLRFSVNGPQSGIHIGANGLQPKPPHQLVNSASVSSKSST